MKVLFDHNLSPRLARSLQALLGEDYEIVALRDKFPATIKDVDLITLLSNQGDWVLISGDRRITRNKAEKRAFQNSRIVGMFLSAGLYKAPVLKQAERLIAIWSVIETVAHSVKGGSMFEIPMKSNRLAAIR